MFTTDDCKELRRQLKPIAEECAALRHYPHDGTLLHQEAIANVTLAFRHLEDAGMRLGKAIQALDGGVSVYDKAEVPGV